MGSPRTTILSMGFHSWHRQSMGTAGLHHLLADSGVYAAGSVDQILTGKQYNRGIRAMTLVYQALIEAYIESFISWLQDEHDQYMIPDAMWNMLRKADTAFSMQDISFITLLKGAFKSGGRLLSKLMNIKEC